MLIAIDQSKEILIMPFDYFRNSYGIISVFFMTVTLNVFGFDSVISLNADLTVIRFLLS